MMCGNRPNVPSGNGTRDTGHHAPGDANVVSIRPPTDSPRRIPSPVADGTASVKCRIGGKQTGPALVVVREATCREHDTAPRPNLDLTPGARDHGPANAPAIFDQPYDRRGRAKLHIQIGGRPEQAAHQGETVAQLHTAVMACEVDQMPAWIVMPMNVVSRSG
jgi:hypothetical protein